MLNQSLNNQLSNIIETLSGSALILFALFVYTPIFITLIIDKYFKPEEK